MAPRSPSRDRLLDAAESLLRRGGLAAAAIKQVVAVSGAPIGSVYHHFPRGKTQLAVEALRRHGERARALLEGVFAAEDPLPERLRALFHGAAKVFDDAGCREGCAIGNVSLGLGPTDAELRAVCDETFESWVSTIAPRLPWPDEKRRRSFAEMVVAALEGAFVLGRAQGSGQAFRTAGDWLVTAARGAGDAPSLTPVVERLKRKRRST